MYARYKKKNLSQLEKCVRIVEFPDYDDNREFPVFLHKKLIKKHIHLVKICFFFLIFLFLLH